MFCQETESAEMKKVILQESNNVISRLELYYEESGLMEINSEGEGKGTEAVIYIPVHEN